MLFWLSCLLAHEYIIVTDLTKATLHACVQCETAPERLLQDVLTTYLDIYKYGEGFLRIVRVIHKYCRRKLELDHIEPSVEEIKILIIMNIIERFKCGNFHIEMLNYVRDCDVTLALHWKTICKYNIEDVCVSIQKQPINYDEKDYEINSSVHLAFQIYLKILIEIIRQQIKNNRWSWQQGDEFTEHITKVMPHAPRMIPFVFQNSANKYKNVNITISNVFYPSKFHTNILKWCKKRHRKYTHAILVYSGLELLEIFDPYLDSFDSNITPFEILIDMYYILVNNPDFKAFRMVLRALNLLNGRLEILVCVASPIVMNFTEKSCGLSTTDNFEEWKKRADITEKQILALIILFRRLLEVKLNLFEMFSRQ